MADEKIEKEIQNKIEDNREKIDAEHSARSIANYRPDRRNEDSRKLDRK